MECGLSGLLVRGLVWCAGRERFALDPDPLRLAARQLGTVVASPAAGRALADVLAGLATREDGEVDVGRVALVPPGGALLPTLTVEDNLGLGLRVRSAADLRARVEPAARLLQVEGALRLFPNQLSDAQQLRAGMARALAAEPALVVLEDRAGLPPCGPAVTAATGQVAVLVIGEDRARLQPAGDRLWTAVPLGPVRHRHRSGA